MNKITDIEAILFYIAQFFVTNFGKTTSIFRKIFILLLQFNE